LRCQPWLKATRKLNGGSKVSTKNLGQGYLAVTCGTTFIL
jgi:hypothetical protein